MSLADVEKIVKQLKNQCATAGFYKTAHYPGGQSVAYVASIHEYGAPSRRIPPRPFLRPTIADNKGKWADKLNQQVEKALKGEIAPGQVFERIGLTMEAGIKQAIVNVNAPPLSAVTLALRQKRRDLGVYVLPMSILWSTMRAAKEGTAKLSANTKPLEETGYMLASVTSKSGLDSEFTS